jgi:predicted acyltransferase
MLVLIGFGLAIQLFYHFDFTHLRFPGVLQRIGVVYFVVTILFLKLDQRILDYLFGVLLIGYYLIMTQVPVPDGHLPNLEPSTNLAAFVDRLVFSTRHIYKQTRYWDPVGLLTTLPAICTSLLGVRIAVWMKSAKLSSHGKILRLSAAGVVCLVLGIIADKFFPINKQLWTSSYVLFTGGICILALTACYWLIDVRGYRKLFWPFLIFGTNALTAYIVSEVLPGVLDLFKITIRGQQVSVMKLTYYFFSRFMTPNNASLLSAVFFVFFVWLLLSPLFKRNIILKI